MMGKLYTHDEKVYVILKTSLGYAALCITDLTCFGVPRKTIGAAIDGLTPTGLQVDLQKSQMIDVQIDY